jgi:ketosteroid isomerase-like protein
VTANNNLTPRQMLLGQYVAQLFADGTLRKGARTQEVAAEATRAFVRDIHAVLTFVGGEVLRHKAHNFVDRLAEFIRR